MIKITLRASFMTPPLERRDLSEVVEDDKLLKLNLRPMRRGEVYIGPKLLPISECLVRDIERWDNDYQSTYNFADPQNSCFPSSEKKNQHILAGAKLVVRLQRELGVDFLVEYGV